MPHSIKDANNGDSNANMLYIPMSIFATLCPVLVATRVWARKREGGKLGGDDWTIMASLLFALTSSGLEVASCYYGFGKHWYSLSGNEKTEALRYFYVTQVTYKASVNLTKLSILLLYLRIFSSVRWFKWACWFLVICVSIFAISSVVATIFQCIPISRAFDKNVEGTCIDNGKFWYANAGFSIGTGLLVLFLPMTLVWQLQIRRLQKIALVLVFALGGFVVITSCLRVTTIDTAATTTDITYDVAPIMWAIIEMNVAIVCACLPMMRPLMVKMFPHLMPKSSSANQATYGLQSYAGMSFVATHKETHGKDKWIQINRGKEGICMTTLKKPGSTGSEESILGNATVQAGPSTSEGSLQKPEGQPVTGIKKTVQYSVEYTSK